MGLLERKLTRLKSPGEAPWSLLSVNLYLPQLVNHSLITPLSSWLLAPGAAALFPIVYICLCSQFLVWWFDLGLQLSDRSKKSC